LAIFFFVMGSLWSLWIDLIGMRK